MLLDVSKLKNAPGSTLPFEVSLDLSELRFGEVCAERPVTAVGSVRNTAGVFLLDGTLTAELRGPCDRCGKETVKTVCYPLKAVLAETLEDERDEAPDLFLLMDGQADLDEIVTNCYVLQMDSKFLCREDCRGLCPRCGRDLNLGDCCCKPEPDPRLAVLKQLLQET